MTTFWTPARETHLAILTRRGLSATQIGEQLGCSRSAVVAKVLRGDGRFGRLDGQPRRKAAVAFPQPAAAAPAPALPDAPSEPVSFLSAILAGTCLWFAGEEYGHNGPEMPVCGGARQAGTRYCARHARMVGRRDAA